MITLECAVIDRGPLFREALERSLESIPKREHVEIRWTWLSWPAAWSEFVQRIVHRTAPDVMELGSTWVPTFRAMNALRPFSPSEIRMLGGVDRFLLPLWRSARSEEMTWGIPWLADLRLVFYRKDALERAGVDERAFRMFKDPTEFERMLRDLSARQSLRPWVVPTTPERNTLHHIASWIWYYGGDFVKPDGTLTFAEEPALRGICAYFRLGPLMGCPIPRLHAEQADQMFWEGHAAATIGGWWIWDYAGDALRPYIGLALPPGPPFLGGSLLGIWQETRVPNEILIAVLARMVHPDTLLRITRIPGTPLPAQPDPLIERVANLPQPDLEIMRTGMYYSNTFPSFSLLGVIEDRLTDTLGKIWAEIMNCPEDIESIVRSHLRHAYSAIRRAISS